MYQKIILLQIVLKYYALIYTNKNAENKIHNRQKFIELFLYNGKLLVHVSLIPLTLQKE